MNKHKIATNYMLAVQTQAAAEDQVNQALQNLGSDNQVFNLAEPILNAYSNLVQEILGPTAWEWLTWWMYETDYGKSNMSFTIDDQNYDPTQLSFEQFWKLVNA